MCAETGKESLDESYTGTLTEEGMLEARGDFPAS